MDPESTGELRCQSWRIQIPEPEEQSTVALLRAQEEYIGEYLSPWLLDAPTWLENLHSFHLMRYFRPEHLDGFEGIVFVLRFLGGKEELAAIEASVREKLEKHKASGVINKFEIEETKLWADSVLLDYGGPEASDSWASFLAAATWLALSLLRDPARDFSARRLVVANWEHCLRLISLGTG